MSDNGAREDSKGEREGRDRSLHEGANIRSRWGSSPPSGTNPRVSSALRQRESISRLSRSRSTPRKPGQGGGKLISPEGQLKRAYWELNRTKEELSQSLSRLDIQEATIQQLLRAQRAEQAYRQRPKSPENAFRSPTASVQRQQRRERLKELNIDPSTITTSDLIDLLLDEREGSEEKVVVLVRQVERLQDLLDRGSNEMQLLNDRNEELSQLVADLYEENLALKEQAKSQSQGLERSRSEAEKLQEATKRHEVEAAQHHHEMSAMLGQVQAVHRLLEDANPNEARVARVLADAEDALSSLRSRLPAAGASGDVVTTIVALSEQSLRLVERMKQERQNFAASLASANAATTAAKQRSETLEAEHKRLIEKLKVAQSDVEDANLQCDRRIKHLREVHSSEMEELQHAMTALNEEKQSETTKYLAQIRDLHARIERLSTKLTVAEGEHEGAQQRLMDAEEQLLTKDRKISETLAQLERYESLASKVSSRERELEDVVERLESSLHMAKDEAARMRARLSDANAVIEGKEEELQLLQRQLASVEAQAAAEQEASSRHASLANSRNERLKTLSAEYEQLQEQVRTLRIQCEEVTQAKAAAQRASSELSSLRSREKPLREEIEHLRTAASEHAAERTHLQTTVQRLEEEVQALQQAKKEDHSRYREEVFRLEEELRQQRVRLLKETEELRTKLQQQHETFRNRRTDQAMSSEERDSLNARLLEALRERDDLLVTVQSLRRQAEAAASANESTASHTLQRRSAGPSSPRADSNDSAAGRDALRRQENEQLRERVTQVEQRNTSLLRQLQSQASKEAELQGENEVLENRLRQLEEQVQHLRQATKHMDRSTASTRGPPATPQLSGTRRQVEDVARTSAAAGASYSHQAVSVPYLSSESLEEKAAGRIRLLEQSLNDSAAEMHRSSAVRTRTVTSTYHFKSQQLRHAAAALERGATLETEEKKEGGSTHDSRQRGNGATAGEGNLGDAQSMKASTVRFAPREVSPPKGVNYSNTSTPERLRSPLQAGSLRDPEPKAGDEDNESNSPTRRSPDSVASFDNDKFEGTGNPLTPSPMTYDPPPFLAGPSPIKGGENMK